MAFGETRDDRLPLVCWQLAIDEIARDASDVRHPVKLIDEVEIVSSTHADRLEVVGHARWAVDDADRLGSTVFPRSLVDDVANLGESGGLEPIATDRLKRGRQYERRLALQDVSGRKLLCFRHMLFLLVAGVEGEASVRTGSPIAVSDGEQQSRGEAVGVVR